MAQPRMSVFGGHPRRHQSVGNACSFGSSDKAPAHLPNDKKQARQLQKPGTQARNQAQHANARTGESDVTILGIQNVSASLRAFIFGFSDTANHSLVFDATQEGNQEDRDRDWRRWQHVCTKAGRGSDPLLTSLSDDQRDLHVRSFLPMRSCEATTTTKPGRTRIIDLDGVTF
jgi:hypothetical protein